MIFLPQMTSDCNETKIAQYESRPFMWQALPRLTSSCSMPASRIRQDMNLPQLLNRVCLSIHQTAPFQWEKGSCFNPIYVTTNKKGATFGQTPLKFQRLCHLKSGDVSHVSLTRRESRHHSYRQNVSLPIFPQDTVIIKRGSINYLSKAHLSLGLLGICLLSYIFVPKA